MSFEALAWASKVHTKNSADKLVLLGLAECAGRDDGLAYPSIAALCEFSSLNRKTIIAALDRLEVAGWIIDTGDCAGRTRQVKVYRLALSNCPKNGTGSKSGTRPKNGTVKQSQKRNVYQSQKRDTEPVREPIPLIPSNEGISPNLENQEVEAVDPAAEPAEVDEPETVELKPAHVVEAWNAMAERTGLPVVKRLTETRLKHLKTRIRQNRVKDFTDALGAIERSRWLCGENDRGWRADFDFFLQPKSFTKLIEGGYDN